MTNKPSNIYVGTPFHVRYSDKVEDLPKNPSPAYVNRHNRLRNRHIAWRQEKALSIYRHDLHNVKVARRTCRAILADPTADSSTREVAIRVYSETPSPTPNPFHPEQRARGPVARKALRAKKREAKP